MRGGGGVITYYDEPLAIDLSIPTRPGPSDTPVFAAPSCVLEECCMVYQLAAGYHPSCDPMPTAGFTAVSFGISSSKILHRVSAHYEYVNISSK